MVFLEKLINSIITNKDMPKVQVEREISPILDIFMDDILKEMIGQDNDSFKHIMSEFPIQSLKKENDKQTNRSVNIDSLFLQNDDTLVFVELKTDKTSYKVEQKERYVKLIEKIKNDNADFLFDFLENYLAKKGSKKAKYITALNLIKDNFDLDGLKQIKKARLIYIVPNSTKEKIKNETDIDKVIDFTQISDLKLQKHIYTDEWKIITKDLRKLDEN